MPADDVEFSKRCTKCRQVYTSRSDFYRNRSTRDGLAFQCKACQRENTKTWREGNPEKARSSRKQWRNETAAQIRDARLFKQYGLPIGEFDKMIERQNGCCSICRRKFKTRKETHVDHCHSTNKIRGLLCHSCNIGIGNLKDSVDNLLRAVEYLSNDSTWLDPVPNETLPPVDSRRPDCPTCGTPYTRLSNKVRRCETCFERRQEEQKAIIESSVGPISRTHCRQGHEYTPETVYMFPRPDGTLRFKDCKVCMRDRARKKYPGPTPPPPHAPLLDSDLPPPTRTHCRSGHLLDAENTRIRRNADGSFKDRACRICLRAQKRASRQAAKARMSS